MEKILIRYKGNVKVHPNVFLALSIMHVKILKLHYPSIFMSWVAMVSSSCFIRSSIGIQPFAGELKRTTTPYTYVGNCREFLE